MTKQEFKEKFIANLRFYLPDEFKDVKIQMRVAKKNEKNLYYDTETKSVRTVTHGGVVWRIETGGEIFGIDGLMLLAHYKTTDAAWDYKGKGE